MGMYKKVSKKKAEYVEHYEGKRKCRTCEHYEDCACERVMGEINPKGHCILYKAED